MKINKPIPKLTQENLGNIIDKFPTKYKMGFIIEEIERLLKPNNIEGTKFQQGMYGKTYTLIENNPIYYHRDVFNILRELI
jgi:hypothetical protein